MKKKKKSPFDVLDALELPEDSPTPSSEKCRTMIPLTNPELAQQKAERRKKGVSSTTERYRTINLKQGNPQVAQAIKLLQKEINQAKKSGIKTLKIIHGYGSSGKGGALKEAVKEPLENARSLGTIVDYISGEEFKCYNQQAVELVSNYPHLKKDHDYLHDNPGITIIIVNP